MTATSGTSKVGKDEAAMPRLTLVSLNGASAFDLTSGPSPSLAFLAGGGALALPASTSRTTLAISAVVPLYVRRRYGSRCANDQRTSPATVAPVSENHVPLL